MVNARRLWVLYRLTPADQKAIEEFQARHPAFCLLLGRNMGTDHDHATGQIRGRLDWRINKAYGLLEKACPDNLGAVLRALADYHEKPPAVTALGAPRFGLMGQAKYKHTMLYGPPPGHEEEDRKRRKKKSR